jgi:Ribbon-helix-helix protein, copG family
VSKKKDTKSRPFQLRLKPGDVEALQYLRRETGIDSLTEIFRDAIHEKQRRVEAEKCGCKKPKP